MSSWKQRIVGIIVGTMLSTGCGGGTSGTGAYVTGLEKSRTIDTISPTEIDRICSDTRVRIEEVFSDEAACPAFSRIFAESGTNLDDIDIAAQCRDFESTCFSSSDDETPTGCTLTKDVEGCSVQVETLDQCLDDIFNSYEDAFSRLTCEGDYDLAAAEQIDFLLSTGTAPTFSCGLLRAQCPKLFNPSGNA